MIRANEKPNHKRTGCETESLLGLQLTLLRDIEAITDISLARDIATISFRVEREGLSFLTKTLPAFGKNILSSYNTGTFQSQTAFSRTSGSALPKFLYGLTSRLFCDTGVLRTNPCYVAAWAVHQITQFLYKYELPYTKEVQDKMLQRMKETDSSLVNIALRSSVHPDYGLESLIFNASHLIGEVLRDFDFTEIYPSHGPGSTNEGTVKQYDKYKFRRPDELLDFSYPQGEYYIASPWTSENSHRWGLVPFKATFSVPQPLRGLRTDDTLRTAKVACVPKDSRGPRVISAEAKELMWVQQGLNTAFVRLFELHPLTKGHVNFRSQDVNRELALEGSRDNGVYTTIDMQEASDRVSLSLIGELFPSEVFAALYSTRSQYNLVPFSKGSETIRLNKFAPMGSAVCFPVESIIFWALSVAGLMTGHNMSIDEAANHVYVYGDDIIVPDWAHECVVKSLERVGMKINASKSFSCGPFRESCGMDAFLGVDITPVRLKSRMPTKKSQAELLVGWTDTANLLKRRGLEVTAEEVFKLVEKFLGKLPNIPVQCGVLGREDPLFDFEDLSKATNRTIKFVPKYIGEGFVVLGIDPKSFNRPDYQGRFISGWVLSVKTFEPTQEEFSEAHAYLRYFSLKKNSTLPVEGVRRFADNRNVRLRWKKVVIT